MLSVHSPTVTTISFLLWRECILFCACAFFCLHEQTSLLAISADGRSFTKLFRIADHSIMATYMCTNAARLIVQFNLLVHASNCAADELV